MKTYDYGWGTGFAIVTSIVLVVVIVYTIIKLRQQVRKAEEAEKRKSAGPLSKNNRQGKDRK